MPVLLMDRLLKFAMPPLTVMLVVPLSVPPPGFALMARVILSLLSVVTRLLLLSRTSTLTAGLIALPALAFVGCWLKKRCVPAGVTLNALEVAPVKLPELAASV